MSEKKWTPTDAQRRILVALQEEANKEESAAKFCRDFCPFTESKFSKIMKVLNPESTESYFDDIKDPEGLMEDLKDLLSRIPRMRLEREQAKENPIYPISTFRAAAVSIRACKNRTTPERITKYIAPTGASKTTLRKFLMHEFRTELSPAYVECRDSWKPVSSRQRHRARWTALLDICHALGMRLPGEITEGNNRDIGAVEDALMSFCTETRRLLIFDEGEFFSAYVLNLVKMLLNKTRLVILIMCTPRAHAKWNTYYTDEADQIARRTNAVIKSTKIKTEDAALFFPDGQFAEVDQSLEYIVSQANVFGHFSLIARVAERLKRSSKAEFKEVQKAVQKGLAEMDRTEWDGQQYNGSEKGGLR